jgi:FG-GAP-like repeat/Immunoglobulin I-set domain
MNTRIQRNIAAVLICLGTSGAAFALGITTQPKDASVSLGANLTIQVFASGIDPLSYQWHFNEAEIAGATKRTLVLTNVQVVSAGDYSAVVTDSSGSVTSLVARLDVDPTFTMITTGPIVTDTGTAASVAWGDYDNDGFPDLLLGNIFAPVDFLYRNKGDGTFERVLTNVVGGLNSGGGSWADYDNDGFLDLYTVSGRDLGVRLFHNEGNGTLLRLTNAAVVGPIISDHSFSGSMSWGGL